MHPMTQAPSPRTSVADFVLDLLDFVEEKIREAIADPASRFAAITEAADAIPVIRHRLRHDSQRLQFALVLGSKFEADHWRDWWDKFAKMERDEFSSEAAALIRHDGAIAALRAVAAG